MKSHKWVAHTTFNFCYGHRVHDQTTVDQNGCAIGRRLHGHNGRVIVHLTGDQPTFEPNNMEWFKHFLETTLDHRFIIDQDDPLFSVLMHGTLRKAREGTESETLLSIVNSGGELSLIPCLLPGTKLVIGYVPEVRQLQQEVLVEMFESMLIVNFTPTCNNIAKWLYDIVQMKMKDSDVNVESLQFYETPEYSVTYTTGV